MLFIFQALKLTQNLSLKLTKTLSLTNGNPKSFSQRHTTTTMPNLKPLNSKISSYMRNGLVEEAQKLFDKMPLRNTVTWNAMIRGYFINGRFVEAVNFFDQMPERDIFSYNTVIDGMMQCGDVDGAREVFDGMPFRDVVTWNSMVSGYIRNGMIYKAVEAFDGMLLKDVISWNATIFGLGENDQGEEGLKLFIRMKESGPSADKATFTSVLTICSDLPTLQFGKQTHADVIKSGFNSFISVSNAMITMYARCGSMHSALLEFSSMSSHDIISWNSIICGYAHHGNAEKSLEMFERMRLTDIMPNHITFVGVLSACSYAGLVDQGRYYFDFMKSKCCLQPEIEHYTCIVDLLGRFGLIDEAMNFLDQMRADGVEVPASVWGALLGACRIYKNIEVGKVAGGRVLEVDPCNSGVYLILAELFLSGGKREEAEKIWAQMKENGVKKQPGCSWIEVNRSAHIFLSGDSSHPEFSRVCCVLDLIHMELEIKISESNAVSFQQIKVPFDGHYG
ncbi:pentatricopeptide repeat-containing protein At4g02750-like [Quercus lobata]|nr:pentatricopeptide repeat-containing protein At4g02750-like [Quercus lobata]